MPSAILTKYGNFKCTSPAQLTYKELSKSRYVAEALESRCHEAGIAQVVEAHQATAHAPTQVRLGHTAGRDRIGIHISVV